MSEERDLILYYLNIYYSHQGDNELSDDQRENIQSIKRVVELNPILNNDERNLLNIVYKNAVSSRRSTIRDVTENIRIISESQVHQQRLQKLNDFRELLFREVYDICMDLIDLIETSILPATSEPELRVFYEKLKGDFYRYICENREKTPEIEDLIQKASTCYQTGMEIAKSELSPTNINFLGLVLNYTVFLYEIVENKNEAIELSKNTFMETVDLMDQMDDSSYSDTATILQLLKLNTKNWIEERDKE